jgi:hypothetical protein|eukprot:COSAG06_NODE_10420_length_1684_cov_1.747003_2_plen_91_part_00
MLQLLKARERVIGIESSLRLVAADAIPVKNALLVGRIRARAVNHPPVCGSQGEGQLKVSAAAGLSGRTNPRTLQSNALSQISKSPTSHWW